jgi:hypothetical protein
LSVCPTNLGSYAGLESHSERPDLVSRRETINSQLNLDEERTRILAVGEREGRRAALLGHGVEGTGLTPLPSVT